MRACAHARAIHLRVDRGQRIMPCCRCEGMRRGVARVVDSVSDEAVLDYAVQVHCKLAHSIDDHDLAGNILL